MKKYFCYGKKDFCTSFECDKGVDCAHYDGSGGEDRDAPMTNADRINSMTIEEKADFLSSIAYGRETPWSYRFVETFCKECTTVHGTYESGVEDDFHECDFVDGKCPHGSDIVWWLQQPAEGDSNA